MAAAHCRLQAAPHCTAHYCTTALALVDTMHCTILHYSCTLHYCTGLGWAGLIVLPSPFCNAHYTRLALDWHQTLVRECRSALSYKGCTALYCTALHWAHCPALPMVCHSFPLRHSTKDHYSHRRASKSPNHLKNGLRFHHRYNQNSIRPSVWLWNKAQSQSRHTASVMVLKVRRKF